MINNELRIGNFTSSPIVALLSKNKKGDGFGQPALTYIMEKRLERMLGRSIDNETDARPLSWGKLLEKRVFELLGIDYTLSSTETDLHPNIPYWAGSKDGTHEGKERAIIEIKCPITLKSFCQLVLPLYCGLDGLEAMNAIRNGFAYKGIEYPAHKDGEKYYAQIVSNACINNLDYGELIVYMPYQSEIPAIRQMADGEANMYWLTYSEDSALPYLVDGGYFRNLNIIRFPIPKGDKIILTDTVIRAGKLLIDEDAPILISGEEINGTSVLIAE